MSLYSDVSRTIKKYRQVHSALVMREDQLCYLLSEWQPCCEDHAYAVVVPMSTHVVGDQVFGNAVSGTPIHGTGPSQKLAFRMPMEVFLDLDLIDIKRKMS